MNACVPIVEEESLVREQIGRDEKTCCNSQWSTEWQDRETFPRENMIFMRQDVVL